MGMNFFQRLDLIDQIVEQKPRDEAVINQLVSLLKEEASRQYMLEKLAETGDPEWLRVLHDRAFFSNPPNAVLEANLIRYPAWPESKYLVKMAGSAPAMVCKIALSLADTDNIFVRNDIVEAAMAMPPDEAAKIAHVVTKWLSSGTGIAWPDNTGLLIQRLSEAGIVDTALDLAQALLAISSDTPCEKSSRFVGAKIQVWDYQDILTKHIPSLVNGADLRALELLCDLLETAVRQTNSNSRDLATADGSSIWRRSVEDDSDTHYPDVRDLLASAVRDGAVELARHPKIGIAAVLDILERHKTQIFRRIGFHMLRVVPCADLTLIADRLVDKNSVDNMLCREYSSLLAEKFAYLAPSDQQHILSLLKEGPDLEEYRRGWEEFGRSVSNEDLMDYAERWLVYRLELIKDTLPPEWRSRYDCLCEEHSGRDDLDETCSEGQAPPQLRTVDDLAEMSPNDLVTYLNKEASIDPKVRGRYSELEKSITVAVSKNRGKFSKSALVFRNVEEPTFLRAVINGLIPVDGELWKHLLGLFGWVASLPADMPCREAGGSDRDPGWQWTKKFVVDYLNSALDRPGEGDPETLPLSYRDRVWDVLLVFTNDPDPEENYEALDKLEAGSDAVLGLLNTVRGRAMECVVKYALWVSRNDPEHSNPGQRCLVPEVKEVLENHLDTDEEASPAVRSLYGLYYTHLFYLDRKWVEDNIDRIFPKDADKAVLFDAAWSAYTRYCPPRSEHYRALADAYALAAVSLDRDRQTDDHRDTSNRQLGRHLLVFYSLGEIDSDSADNPLFLFFEKASSELREDVITYAGESVEEFRKYEAKSVARLQRLWERRLSEAKDSGNPAAYRKEISAFGWWFLSGQFPPDWAMENLAMAAELVGWIEPDDDVVAGLADISQSNPAFAVKCLRLMLNGVPDPWRMNSHWLENAFTIVGTGLEDETTHGSAVELGNRFGEMGNIKKFRPLFSSIGTDKKTV